MDIRLKAPLIIIPQSSTSHNALVVDLGLITVANSFSLLPIEGCPLPAVIDNMDVHLGDLKLSRSVGLKWKLCLYKDWLCQTRFLFPRWFCSQVLSLESSVASNMFSFYLYWFPDRFSHELFYWSPLSSSHWFPHWISCCCFFFLFSCAGRVWSRIPVQPLSSCSPSTSTWTSRETCQLSGSRRWLQ